MLGCYRAASSLLAWRLLREENRTRREPDDALRGAAHDSPVDLTVPVIADDEQVVLTVLCNVHDRLDLVTLPDDRLHVHPAQSRGIVSLFGEPAEVFVDFLLGGFYFADRSRVMREMLFYED